MHKTIEIFETIVIVFEVCEMYDYTIWMRHTYIVIFICVCVCL